MPSFPPILILTATFYQDIATALVTGAKAALDDHCSLESRYPYPYPYQCHSVAGALELPLALNFAAKARNSDATPKWHGFILLGCVIRGETSHYDIVANESARALIDVALHHNIAVGNGILTVNHHAQAVRRAAPDGPINKGAAAAQACLGLMTLRNSLELR